MPPSYWRQPNSTAASNRHYRYPRQQSPAILRARVVVGTFYADTALTRWKALTKLRPLPHIRRPGLAARNQWRTSAVPTYRRFFMPATTYGVNVALWRRCVGSRKARRSAIEPVRQPAHRPPPFLHVQRGGLLQAGRSST